MWEIEKPAPQDILDRGFLEKDGAQNGKQYQGEQEASQGHHPVPESYQEKGCRQGPRQAQQGLLPARKRENASLQSDGRDMRGMETDPGGREKEGCPEHRFPVPDESQAVIEGRYQIKGQCSKERSAKHDGFQ